MEQPPSKSPSVGFPLPYTRIHILDQLGNECCAGDEGEVFIVGSGVSAGYLNAEEIHSERFVELPTPAGRAERAYRTGDIGALSPEGELRLLGRKDRQIKIHGHRIELDEVEMAINVLSGIRECAVVVAKERLVAHVVLDGVTVDQARKSVVEQLPPWMRPVSYVTHASLPRTTSGKVDRTCLSHAA
jgi:acyl-coenzyme A synthetase/AMP-(fatty) acid ligase